MKKIELFIIILYFVFFVSELFAAEWIVCDIPDPVEEVVEYAITLDGSPEVIVPYQENTAGDAVLLWDITGISSAQFSIFSINSQGRRSVTATPFYLLPAPLGPGGIKIILP